MTKEEFVAQYCKRSGVTKEFIGQYKDALPCACGDESCEGWAMVGRDPGSIKVHMELYAPILMRGIK